MTNALSQRGWPLFRSFFEIAVQEDNKIVHSQIREIFLKSQLLKRAHEFILSLYDIINTTVFTVQI